MPTYHLTLIVDGADVQSESVVNSLFESDATTRWSAVRTVFSLSTSTAKKPT